MPLLSSHSQLTPPRTAQSPCEWMNCHSLCDHWQHHPGIPPRWWCGQAARGVAHTVVLGVSKCLPPCPGKAKLILKTNKSSPGLPPVPLCYPPAAGSECCWSWGGRCLWWSSSPLLTPQCRVGARLHQGSLPLTPDTIFGVSLRPQYHVMPLGWEFLLSFLGFSSFRQLHLPGVSVGVGAVGRLFLAV